MTKKSPDLPGNAPDNASVALLLIDLINDLDFVGGDELLTYAGHRVSFVSSYSPQFDMPGRSG